MCLVLRSLMEELVWLYSEDEVVFKSTRCMLYTGENPA